MSAMPTAVAVMRLLQNTERTSLELQENFSSATHHYMVEFLHALMEAGLVADRSTDEKNWRVVYRLTTKGTEHLKELTTMSNSKNRESP